MRYEPEHKTQTRDRIVRNAARKLRAEGLSGPDVAGIMKASGLTVGGFYKHFRSKDELLAEAIAQPAGHRGVERFSVHRADRRAAEIESLLHGLIMHLLHRRAAYWPRMDEKPAIVLGAATPRK